MHQEHGYVNYFYDKYEGRVAIGVGYNHDLSEIYPFVFEDTEGKSIGIVALGVITYENITYVHIYHLGSFKTNCGNGGKILRELCFQADKYQIVLTLSPVFMANGNNETMSDERLSKWYGGFGFEGSPQFKRDPVNIIQI